MISWFSECLVKLPYPEDYVDFDKMGKQVDNMYIELKGSMSDSEFKSVLKNLGNQEKCYRFTHVHKRLIRTNGSNTALAPTLAPVKIVTPLSFTRSAPYRLFASILRIPPSVIGIAM